MTPRSPFAGPTTPNTHGGTSDDDLSALQDRLQREADDAIRQFHELGVVLRTDVRADRSTLGAAQREVRQRDDQRHRDVVFARRHRLADRIDRLAAALERLGEGTYGTCALCRRPIEVTRLVVTPEVDTCVDCHETRERLLGRQAA